MVDNHRKQREDLEKAIAERQKELKRK